VTNIPKFSKKKLLIFLSLLFFFFLSLFFVKQLAYQRKKVILMVWDGTQRNHLNELLAAGKLPNLQKIIDEGAKRDDLVIFSQNCKKTNDGDNYKPSTNPAHAAILTGYGYPIMNNYSNEEPNSIPEGLTLFERLKKINPKIKIGMITGEALPFFPFPAFQNIAPPDCCYSANKLCGKRNSSLPPIIDTCLLKTDYDFNVRERAEKFLEENYNNSFFLFVLFREPDLFGHLHDENSNEYSEAIISNDTQLGIVISKLKDLGIYDNTFLLITTDHGFSEGKTFHSPCVNDTKNLWLVSNKKWVIESEGNIAKQTSITPTIFDIFGLSKNVTPAFAGESLFTPPSP
jgi:predicted AlkP superfamily pyrophosphatase or phosphodiesterase